MTAAKNYHNYNEVAESIKMIFDLTSRIDERVKMLIQRTDSLEERIDNFIEKNQDLAGSTREDLYNISKKVGILENHDFVEEIVQLKKSNHKIEIKIENLNNRVGSHDKTWSKIFDAIWKVSLMLVAGFILWKLGIPMPSN